MLILRAMYTISSCSLSSLVKHTTALVGGLKSKRRSHKLIALNSCSPSSFIHNVDSRAREQHCLSYFDRPWILSRTLVVSNIRLALLITVDSDRSLANRY